MPHWAHLEGVHAGFRSIRLLPVCILPWGRRSACVFFGCEVKNPLRTNALGRQAVLPLGVLYSLLEQRIKQKNNNNNKKPQNKAFKQWITTDRSFRHHKQRIPIQDGNRLKLYKVSEIQILTFGYTLYLAYAISWQSNICWKTSYNGMHCFHLIDFGPCVNISLENQNSNLQFPLPRLLSFFSALQCTLVW